MGEEEEMPQTPTKEGKRALGRPKISRTLTNSLRK